MSGKQAVAFTYKVTKNHPNILNLCPKFQHRCGEGLPRYRHLKTKSPDNRRYGAIRTILVLSVKILSQISSYPDRGVLFS